MSSDQHDTPINVGRWVNAMLSPGIGGNYAANDLEFPFTQNIRNSFGENESQSSPSAMPIATGAIYSPSPPKTNPYVPTSSSEKMQDKRIRQLEIQIAEARNVSERLNFELERTKQIHRKELQEEQNKSLRLEKDRKLLLQSECDLQQRLKDLEEKYTFHQEFSENKLQQLQKTSADLRDHAMKIESKHEHLDREYSHATTSFQSQLTHAHRQIESLQTEIQRLMEHEKSSKQSPPSSLLPAAQSPASHRDLVKEIEFVRAANAQERLQRELLEKEALALRAAHEQLMPLVDANRTLNEEKHVLSLQVQHLNDVAQKCNALENEVLIFRREKQEWSAFLQETEMDSPYAIASALARLRQEHLISVEKENSLALQLSQTIKQSSELQYQLQTIKSQLQESEERWQRECRSAKRFETLYQLALKETNVLKEQISLYDHEYSTDKGKELVEQMGKISDEYRRSWHDIHEEIKQQVEANSAILKEKKETILNADDVSSSTVQQEIRSAAEISHLTKEYDTLRVDNEMLKKEVDSLIGQMTLYEERLGRGEYNSETTKVLQLIINPEKILYAENMKQLQKLKDENRMLLDKLRGNSEELLGELHRTPSMTLLQKDRMDLERRIQEADLRQQRLREVCSRKIAEFREACYLLTGYRIDMHEDDIFRLTPQFALDESHDHLLFRIDPNQPLGVQIAETEFSQNLPVEVRKPLDYNHCIPAYLAKVILMLFEKSPLGK